MRAHLRRRTGVAVLVTGMLLSLFLVAPPAAAWHPSSPMAFNIGGDIWWNYDWFSNAIQPEVNSAATSTMDWPVIGIFFDGASEISLLNSLPGFGCCGGAEHFYRYIETNSSGRNQWLWSVPDFGGMKTTRGCGIWDYHIVPYGGDNLWTGITFNSFYNIYWGYYVMVTGHLDYSENCSGPIQEQSGYSEYVKNYLTQQVQTNSSFHGGVTVYDHYANLVNFDPVPRDDYPPQPCSGSSCGGDHLVHHYWWNVSGDTVYDVHNPGCFYGCY